MLNVMAALPNIGGALCPTPLSLAHAHYYTVPCSNAAKTRNPLKLAGVPQTNETISATSIGRSPSYCGGHVGEILLFNKFFPIVDMCLSCEYMARQSCAMVPRRRIFGEFLRPAFPANGVQHISDLHSNSH